MSLHTRPFFRAISACALIGCVSANAFFNPSSYTSLDGGSGFDSNNFAGANTITITTGNSGTDPSISGINCDGSSGGSCTGIRRKADGVSACVSNSDCFAIFTFNSFNLAAGDTLTYDSSSSALPVVILSKSTMALSGTVNLNGVTGVDTMTARGGPGGGAGGSYEVGPAEGTGAGGDGGFTTGGGGGAFGGNGGNGGNAANGGTSYNNNTFTNTILVGGSGGGGNVITGNSGGGGGGAAEFGALGTLSLGSSCIINAKGGGSTNPSPTTESGAGGGSGGGIFLHGHTVNANSASTIDVSGGVGGDGYDSGEGGFPSGGGGGGGFPSGGGGGGGRIYIAYHTSGSSNISAGSCLSSMEFNVDASGGAVGSGGIPVGFAGSVGTCFVASDAGVPVPEAKHYALFFGAFSIALLVYRRVRA